MYLSSLSDDIEQIDEADSKLTNFEMADLEDSTDKRERIFLSDARRRKTRADVEGELSIDFD